jgi:peroxiredoxin
LADYASSHASFKELGVEVAALSVDPPATSASMRRDLGIEFPVLSDTNREVITEWGVLNSTEKGGIAIPSTFLIDRDLHVQFSSAEGIARRVSAREMLAFVRTLKAVGDAPTPPARSINPGLMFMRAIANAFRHGVHVKRH